MTAFGPYGGSETVDFEQLVDLGLFVVAGPNGAGKTTIFDGLYYCLYGRLPGRRHDYPHLRSDHAPPERECSVTLDFAADGRRWRVTRSPRQTRAKRSGSGTTEVTASATLWQLDDGGAPTAVANRINEVNEHCRDLIGLTGPQFERVALLPQGEFSRFLRESSTQRREVLRALFGTGIFDHATSDLRSQAEAERSSHAIARDHIGTQLHNICEHLDTLEGNDSTDHAPGDGQPITPDDIDLSQRLAQVHLRIDELRSTELAIRQRQLADHEQLCDVAAAQHRAAQVHHQTLARRSTLNAELHVLDEQAESVSQQRTRISRAYDAVPVVAAHKSLRQASDHTRAAQISVDRLSTEICSSLDATGVDIATSNGCPVVDAPEVIHARVSARLQGLSELADLLRSRDQIADSIGQAEVERRACVTSLAQIRDQQHQADAGLAEAQATIDDVAGRPTAGQVAEQVQAVAQQLHDGREVDRLNDLIRSSTIALEQLQGLASQAEAELVLALQAQQAQSSLDDQLQVARNRVTELEQAGNALHDIRNLSEQVARQQQDLRHAEDASRQIFEKFIAGAAGRLAATLQTDEPCPVCGSCSHPEPANTPVDEPTNVPDITAVERLRATEQDLRTACRTSSERLDELIALHRETLRVFNERDATSHSVAPDSSRSNLDTLERAQAHAIDTAHQARIAADTNRTRASAAHTHQTRMHELAAEIDAERRNHSEAVSRRDRVLGSLGSAAELTISELEQHLDQARADERRAASDTHRADRAYAALDDNRRRRDSLTAAASVTEARLTDCEIRLSELRPALVHADEALTDRAATETELDTLPSVEAKIQRLKAVHEVLPRHAAAIGALATCIEVEGRARARLAQHLHQSPFDTETTAQAAHLATTDLTQLEQLVADFDAKVQRTAGQLDELPAVPAVVADLAITAQRADQAHADLREARNEFSRFSAELRRAEKSIDTIKPELARLHRADQASVQLQRVAQLVTGDNDHNVSLENWVLGSHLRDVVALANLRLSQSTSGRFQLCVADQGKNRRGRWGIDLEIEDTVTGTRRPTEGLSGGELFQASLALALGLADVVMRLSGGVQIDALFIDEGFGSLDESSVERAVDLLDALRGQGALVGVITHVPTLLNSLPRGITVTARADGQGSTVSQRNRAA